MRHMLTEHGMSLTRFVNGMTRGNRQTTEDVVQETMVRAWQNLDTLPSDDHGSRRWLFTVARRLFIDEVRKRQARPAEVASLDNDLAGTGDGTASAALANHALREAVANLTEAHREVLREVFFEDRTIPDVAVRLGVPVGTVRSRIHYALRSLREAVLA
jgi:RNA polymerase sigma-70 factor (ECF subfamily)